jgi:hypothetical protein
MRGVGDHFTLHLTAFDGSYSRELVFTPVNNKIDIVIGNAPESETGPIALPHAENSDPHFSIYYEFILNNGTGKGPIPFHFLTTVDCPATNPSFICPSPALPPATPAPRAPITPAAKTSKKTQAKPAAKPAAAHDTHVAAAANNGAPVPSGLNCSSSNWP